MTLHGNLALLPVADHDTFTVAFVKGRLWLLNAAPLVRNCCCVYRELDVFFLQHCGCGGRLGHIHRAQVVQFLLDRLGTAVDFFVWEL